MRIVTELGPAALNQVAKLRRHFAAQKIYDRDSGQQINRSVLLCFRFVQRSRQKVRSRLLEFRIVCLRRRLRALLRMTRQDRRWFGRLWALSYDVGDIAITRNQTDDQYTRCFAELRAEKYVMTDIVNACYEAFELQPPALL